MKKILTWVALLPVALVIAMVAFSPKGAVVAPASAAQASTQTSTKTSAVVMKPTARPVMYEFFTGW